MDNSSAFSSLFLLAACAAVLVLIYHALFGRPDFIIDVRRGQVRCKGRVSLALQRRLAHFLLEDLGIRDSVRILGAQRGKRMRVWFRGQISPGEQQRVRNFLALGP